MSTNKEKGISLYLLLIVMLLVLSISLSLTSLLVIRFKSVQRLGDAIVAFYAADSGIEEQLYDLGNFRGTSKIQTSFSNWASLNASFDTETKCRLGYTKCNIVCGGTGGKNLCLSDSSCPGPRFCITSVGNFKDSKRAIDVKY